MRKIFNMLVVGVWLCAMLLPALAVNPDEVLADPVLEQRARDLSVNIRCLVCQNQSIDDSDAELAKDLRILVREKLVEGLSDKEILDYLVGRYGEFVLLKPRFGIHTIALWGVPIVLLIIGVFAIRRLYSSRKMQASQTEPLSEEEQKRLDQLMKQSK